MSELEIVDAAAGMWCELTIISLTWTTKSTDEDVNLLKNVITLLGLKSFKRKRKRKFVSTLLPGCLTNDTKLNEA
jgi:hypothetical protein